MQYYSSYSPYRSYSIISTVLPFQRKLLLLQFWQFLQSIVPATLTVATIIQNYHSYSHTVSSAPNNRTIPIFPTELPTVPKVQQFLSVLQFNSPSSSCSSNKAQHSQCLRTSCDALNNKKQDLSTIVLIFLVFP
jgi:hypothetical protein